MAKYQFYSQEQGVFETVNYKLQLIPGSFEHSLDYFIENKIDLSIFDDNYINDETGAYAKNPKILLKAILLGFYKGLIPSRDIEEAVKNNILFKAMTGGKIFHFTTIASFIRKNEKAIMELFVKVLLICSEAELIGNELLAVDGCKIRSNASKEWSGTFKDLKKKKEKFEKLAEFIIEKNKKEGDGYDEDKKKKEKDRIEKIEKNIEKIDNFLRSNEPKKGKRNHENKSNITDNESAKMKSNKGVIQGYNGLAVVDSKHQIIISAHAFGNGQDGEVLKEMIDKTNGFMEKIIDGKKYMEDKTLLADNNFFSEDNLENLSKEKINAYIPDQQFRRRDPRFKDSARFKPKNKTEGLYKQKDFRYDQKKDIYICPDDEILSFKRYQKLNNNYGKRYECLQSICGKCVRQEFCLRGKSKRKKRTLFISERDNQYTKKMIAKIDSKEGREIYSKRMGIIEPVFANITYCKGMNRFTLRGEKKVNIQWLLYCIVHNLSKISNLKVNMAKV